MRKKLFINGAWHEAAKYKDLFSPFTGEKIAEIPQASSQQVEEAIAAAYRNRKVMEELSAYERAKILENLVSLLEENKQEIAELISLEAAKPLKYSLGETERTIETYKFAAEEAKQLCGEMIPMNAARNGANRLGYTIRQPVGVVGAITPFNFPLNLVAHKVGPAIAAGNTIVLKPASQTPLSSYLLAELLDKAGMPKGCLHVVTGSGKAVGNQLVNSDKVNMITFTGSPAVGKSINEKAGLKKVSLELGSNAGLIIDQNTDLDKIVPKCVMGAFSNQGQVCISLQRIYVHESLYHEFISKFKTATEQLLIGNPLDEKTDISSLISTQDLDRAMNWIEEASKAGSEIIAGGEVKDNILLPTIIVNAHSKLKVSCQEVFAPIVVVNPVKDVEEGIQQINDSLYGLQAGIYTKDIKTALQASKALEVGGVMINDIPTFRVDQMPYGGVKDSGNAREGLKYAIEEMTEMKLIVWNEEDA